MLDRNGKGTISNIIAALELGGRQREDLQHPRRQPVGRRRASASRIWTDPLTLAAKRVIDLGITVVAAAGNLGKNALGQKQWGGISAPANAPWVLTVGASSTQGTLTRSDDTLASFSSRGPTTRRLPGEARSRGARDRHHLAGRAGQPLLR